jgi:subtilisin family serine protease
MAEGLNSIISWVDLPKYHDNVLLVRHAEQPTEQAAAVALGGSARTLVRYTGRSMGLSAVLRGYAEVKSVTPIFRASTSRATRDHMVFALGGPSTATARSQPEEISLIELKPGAKQQKLLKELRKKPEIAEVSLVPCRYLLGGPMSAVMPPDAKNFSATMWNLQRIEWKAARSSPKYKEPKTVSVAVLDTGIDLTHPKFKGRKIGYVYAHPSDKKASSNKDLVGHGTHVSGTITARITNVDVDGICDCTLKVWKIFTDQPVLIRGLAQYIYVVDPIMYRRALADCVEEKVQVINLSIGGPEVPDAAEQALFNSLLDNETVVVAAMGNERAYDSPTSYPAAIKGVIAVGATAKGDTIAGFSSAGPHISVAAPGEDIWSTLPTYPGQTGFQLKYNGGRPALGAPLSRKMLYDAWQGTSMATPHVTAACAIRLASKGAAKPAAVKASLEAATEKVPQMGSSAYTKDFGYGILSLLKLIE